jgi:hypothetical protein
MRHLPPHNMPIAGFYNHPRRESCPRLSWSPPAPTSQLPEPCAVPARRNLRPRRTLTRRQSQKHRVLNARCQNERSTTQPRHHHARTLAHRRGGPGRAKRAPRARPPTRPRGRIASEPRQTSVSPRAQGCGGRRAGRACRRAASSRRRPRCRRTTRRRRQGGGRRRGYGGSGAPCTASRWCCSSAPSSSGSPPPPPPPTPTAVGFRPTSCGGRSFFPFQFSAVLIPLQICWLFSPK